MPSLLGITNKEHLKTSNKMDNYDRINTAFERAVQRLQDNLQYLADKGQVSDRFVSLQNAIIKALIDYQRQTESIMSGLEMEVMQLCKGKIEELENLRDTKTGLEAICIIHGITDFPFWHAKGMDYLVNEAVELHRQNMMQLPFEFNKMMRETLNEEERETLKIILYKRMEQTQEERLMEVMKDLKINLDILEQIKNARTQGN